MVFISNNWKRVPWKLETSNYANACVCSLRSALKLACLADLDKLHLQLNGPKIWVTRISDCDAYHIDNVNIVQLVLTFKLMAADRSLTSFLTVHDPKAKTFTSATIFPERNKCKTEGREQDLIVGLCVLSLTVVRLVQTWDLNHWQTHRMG